MNKILVPVDFSDTALGALLVAEKMAARFDAKIDVLHIYNGSINTNKGLTLSLIESQEDAILERLKKFTHILPTEGGREVTQNIQYKAELAYNNSGRLVKLSKEYDLIVMGMTGTHTIGKKWIGSIASYVAQHAHCPVLLIPREQDFRGFHKIMYAGNWESVNDFALDGVLKLAKEFQSTIHFVNVNESFRIDEFSDFEQETLAELLQVDFPKIPYIFTNVIGETPQKGLEAYAKHQQVDLMVLVNRQRGILDNFLGRSMTKEMALKAQIPLLVYH